MVLGAAYSPRMRLLTGLRGRLRTLLAASCGLKRPVADPACGSLVIVFAWVQHSEFIIIAASSDPDNASTRPPCDAKGPDMTRQSYESLEAPSGPFRADQIHDGDPYELSNGHPIRCMSSGRRHSLGHDAGHLTLSSDP